METARGRIVETIRKRYGEKCRGFKWITEEEALKAEAERTSLLESVNGHVSYMCNGTKPFFVDVSPGCRLCSEGLWSCLFINGKCNGHCFFCPSEQTSVGEPMTSALGFSSPADYLDYLDSFGFKGVSISGGEPLISFDRTVRFLSAVQERFGSDIYKWLYTNGILLTKDHLIRLKETGLNEIRFNLVMQNYEIGKIETAARYIDTVTVEIPAIPEDYNRMCGVIPKLAECGVKFLNLHQLRCTPYNCENYIKRGYTFLHGPDVTILESELTALRLIRYSAESGTGLPVNYCSFVYRNNFQGTGARKRSASCIGKPFEDITGAGMIRHMSVILPEKDAERTIIFLQEKGIKAETVDFDKRSSRLSFTEDALKYIDRNLTLTLSYYDSMLNASASYRNVFKKIRLNNKKEIVAERWPAMPAFELSGDDAVIFRKMCSGDALPDPGGLNSAKWKDINLMENLPAGLQAYW